MFKYLFLSLFSVFCNWSLLSQDIRKSNTYIDTYYHGEKYFSIKEASLVYHNIANSELRVEISFSDLRSGIDSLDEWLMDLTDSKLVFSSPLPVTDLFSLCHNHAKPIELKGYITFNGKTHEQTVNANFFEVSKDGLVYQNGSFTDSYYDKISVNLQFSFLPKYFNIDKKPHHLRKKISVAIARGIINKQ